MGGEKNVKPQSGSCYFLKRLFRGAIPSFLCGSTAPRIIEVDMTASTLGRVRICSRKSVFRVNHLSEHDAVGKGDPEGDPPFRFHQYRRQTNLELRFALLKLPLL